MLGNGRAGSNPALGTKNKNMKHSELIKIFIKDRYTETGEKRCVNFIRKGSSSGVNYINVIFNSEGDRDEYMAIYSIPERKKCEKRYGIGLIFNLFDVEKRLRGGAVGSSSGS